MTKLEKLAEEYRACYEWEVKLCREHDALLDRKSELKKLIGDAEIKTRQAQAKLLAETETYGRKL